MREENASGWQRSLNRVQFCLLKGDSRDRLGNFVHFSSTVLSLSLSLVPLYTIVSYPRSVCIQAVRPDVSAPNRVH